MTEVTHGFSAYRNNRWLPVKATGKIPASIADAFIKAHLEAQS